jgi:type I restriction enzyme, S subunit
MSASAARLMIVNWRDLPRWDTKTARASASRLANPTFRPLGDFAEEATELVRPWEKPKAEWPVYGVNNEAGVVFSHDQLGESFNAPYKRIRKDWFFHNPTRANVGSLGRVPDVPEDAITSPEYQVWRVHGELLPRYVEILIQTPYFLEQIACHRVGAVKQRLFVRNLLEIPIPHVAEPVQRAIIAAWDASRLKKIAILEKIKQLRQRIETGFLAELGLSPLPKGMRSKVFSVQWKDFERWGVQPNQLAIGGEDISHAKYPIKEGWDCLAEVKHGCSASPSSCPTALEVLKISAATRGAFTPSERKYAVDVPRFRKEFDLRKGDVLMCRTNGSLSLVGMSALVEADKPNLIYPDKLIRVRCRPNILPAFFWKMTQMGFARSQLEAAARTAVGNYAIGSDDIWSLRFPLPPVPVQAEMVKRLEGELSELSTLAGEAATSAADSNSEVEAMIMGPDRRIGA